MPGWLSIAICGGARLRSRVSLSVTFTHKADFDERNLREYYPKRGR
jgi:hypothetical protein